MWVRFQGCVICVKPIDYSSPIKCLKSSVMTRLKKDVDKIRLYEPVACCAQLGTFTIFLSFIHSFFTYSTYPTLWRCTTVSSPPDTYRILVANILYADNYPSANRQPTDFSDAICPQKVFPSVGREHTHNDYIELPTEKVVGNMLATEESVCVWQVFVYGRL